MQFRNYKIVYRRYAGLFFCVCVDANDNELAYLEAIHLFVEILGPPQPREVRPATDSWPLQIPSSTMYASWISFSTFTRFARILFVTLLIYNHIIRFILYLTKSS